MTLPLPPVAVAVRRLPHAEDLALPTQATPGAAAVDLRAAVAAPLSLKPLARALVPTGIAIALPEGVEAQIRPRSGLALRHGLTVLNSPGTIDPDYRGEIAVLLINLGDDIVEIRRGDRIAQLLVAYFAPIVWDGDDQSWGTTERQEKGFGSSGRQ